MICGQETHSPFKEQIFLSIIKYRHDAHLQTIYTSNFELKELGKQQIGDRASWLIRESCTAKWKVPINGCNLRKD